jgi:hypothetical protein
MSLVNSQLLNTQFPTLPLYLGVGRWELGVRRWEFARRPAPPPPSPAARMVN